MTISRILFITTLPLLIPALSLHAMDATAAWNEMRNAIYEGDIELVKHMVEVRKVPVDILPTDAHDPLTSFETAIDVGALPIAQYLFKKNAAVRSNGEGKATPLALIDMKKLKQRIKFSQLQFDIYGRLNSKASFNRTSLNGNSKRTRDSEDDAINLFKKMSLNP